MRSVRIVHAIDIKLSNKIVDWGIFYDSSDLQPSLNTRGRVFVFIWENAAAMKQLKGYAAKFKWSKFYLLK